MREKIKEHKLFAVGMMILIVVLISFCLLAVVLNLEGIDVDVAQRIIDFASGSCYAISGNLQKISHYIFIITPSSVDVSGDFQDIFGGAFDSPLSDLR